MIQFIPDFLDQLPGILDKLAEDLAQMLDREVEIPVHEPEFKHLDQFMRNRDSGAVCVRARSGKGEQGMCGILFDEEATSLLVRAAMMMDSAEPEPFQFNEVVQEAMAEIWNVMLGSWNQMAQPGYRIESGIEERQVEYYEAGISFPAAAGVFSHAMLLPLGIGGRTFTCALFLPAKFFEDPLKLAPDSPASAADTTRPAEAPADGSPSLSSVPAPAPPPGASLDAVPAGTRSSTTTAPAPTAARPPAHPPRPTVFLDYSGMVLPWIRKNATDPRLQYLVVDGKAPPRDESEPIAAVVTGIDLDEIKHLLDCKFIEIRRRGE